MAEHHGKYTRAPVYVRVVGLSALLGLVYLSSSLFARHFYPPGGGGDWRGDHAYGQWH